MSDPYGFGSWAPLATGSRFAALYDGPLLGYATSMGASTDKQKAAIRLNNLLQDLKGATTKANSEQ